MKNSNGKKALLATCIGAILSVQNAYAHDPAHLEHPHGAGTFMVEYKFMRMYMDGLLQGDEDISTDEARALGYSAIPTKMTMDMHMLMPMYNFTRELSIMAMFNYLSNSMEMEHQMGTMTHPGDMETSGLGDTDLSVTYKNSDLGVAGTLSVSVPTGSVSEDTTMHMAGMSDMTMTAPYAMQLGSGTYDITPYLTYLGAYYSLRYGAQVSYTYRLGENDKGYTLGNKAKAMAWVRKPVGPVVLDADVSYTRWGDVEGRHEDIPTADESTSITAKPTNYGGAAVDASFGVAVPVGMASVGADVAMPLMQDLNGVQMKRTWTVSLAVSAMF